MNLIHKRAYVMGKAVSYCQAASGGKQPTTTIKNEKVNCPRCKDIAAGRG